MNLTGKRVLVIGMARSGVAALRLLRAHQAETLAADMRPLAGLGDLAETVTTLADRYLLQTELEEMGVAALEAEMVVLSPGVPADLPILEAARDAGIAVIGEVELAAPFLRGPVMAFTGTNGKTTSTALAGHLLHSAGIPARVGGNIGTPVCDMVETSHEAQWNVLELSSFQLETTFHLAAQIAICLNVTPDHLDRHHTFDDYVAAKRRLFELQAEGSYAVLNADNPPSLRYGFAGPADAKVFTLSNNSQRTMWLDGSTVMHEGKALFTRQTIPLPGLHNVENVMAACLAALLAGAQPEAVARGVASFPGVEHRLEFVRERAGVRWYNDSKATNVDAALKAVASFDSPLWVLLGGRDKHSDYGPLGDALRGKARQALLVGEATELIEAQLGAQIPCQRCDTIGNAVAIAAREAVAGDVVLLAPACASFDQFRSYEQRGHFFKKLVHELDEEQG